MTTSHRSTWFFLFLSFFPGAIPDFSKCLALQVLKLNSNKLTGKSTTITSDCTIWFFPSFQELFLIFPSVWLWRRWFCSWISWPVSRLRSPVIVPPDFCVFFLFLSGAIPDFSKCVALQSLDLGNNQLTGKSTTIASDQSSWLPNMIVRSCSWFFWEHSSWHSRLVLQRTDR